MSLNVILDEIKRAISFRERFIPPEEMKEIVGMYRAQYDTKKSQPINFTFSTTRGMLPYIYFRNPKCLVTARSGKLEHRLAVPLVQGLLDLLIEKLNLKGKIRQASIINSLWGTCIIKVGKDDASGSLPFSLHGQKGYSFAGANTKSKFPWIEIVNTNDFVVPRGTVFQDGTFIKAPWAAQRIISRRCDLYKHFVKDKVDSAPSVQLAYETDTFASDDSIDPIAVGQKKIQDEFMRGKKAPQDAEKIYAHSQEYIIVWEIWKADEGRVLWVAGDTTDQNHPPIQLDEKKFKLDGLPLRSLPFMHACYNHDPVYFWGVSDARLIQPQQKEATLLRTRISQIARQLNVRFAYDSNVVRKEDVDRLLSDAAVAAIPVNGAVNTAITDFSTNIPQELDAVVRMNEEDIRKITGYSENLAGIYHGGRRTATEAETVRSGGQARVDDKRDIMSDLIVDVLRFAVEVVFDSWTGDVVLPLAVPSATQPGMMEVQLVSFKWSDIKSDYTFELNFDDAMPDSAAKRREDAQVVLQVMGQLPEVNQAALAKCVLEAIGSKIDLADLKVNPTDPVKFSDVVSGYKKDANVRPKV